MALLRTSLICTVLNEEKTIGRLIDSIAKQSQLPDEVIFVDGGSKDSTVNEIKKFSQKYPKLNIRISVIKGNRSVGRNLAISKATNEIILSTDSGCVLDRNWAKNIVKPFLKGAEVVAGYYKGESRNIFQKCLIPYVLVMPDKVDPKNFLPATRSMAFKKSAWIKAGKFNEKFSHNEDYAFANKLKENKAKIVFCKDAVATWIPRTNFLQAFKMFFRFSLGDIQAGLYREKVVYIFLRYTFALYLLLLNVIEKSLVLLFVTILFFLGYLIWSIGKNYKYIESPKAYVFLPLIQILSDIAVISGSSIGIFQKITVDKFIKPIINNKAVALVIFVYIVTELSTISYGIPDPSHPFNYFMDEWHQSQSVRDLFRYGTPNIAGAANGSIFQFFLTGLYLIPFTLTGIVNVFAIKSSVLDLAIQHRLFEVLRLNTLLFGVGSIILVSFIAKKYLKINAFLAAFLFTFNPLWLMLSNYFKYDIALAFWILVSTLFFLRYAEKPTFINFLFGGIFSGIALSTKLLTPLPLIAVYFLIFFLFTPNFGKHLKSLIIGFSIVIFVYAFFGNPDILLGKGSLYDYLYSNVVLSPNVSQNYRLGEAVWPYMLTSLYPSVFGRMTYSFYLISLFFVAYIFLNNLLLIPRKSLRLFTQAFLEFLSRYKFEFIVASSFILFMASLIPIGIQATNNRLMVLLPFLTLISATVAYRFIDKIKPKRNLVFTALLLLSIILIYQLAEAYSWVSLKFNNNPRFISSNWIINNIKPNTTIGIQNIPIYQGLPNVVLKEFYLKQYGYRGNNIYNYEVVNSKMDAFPPVVILTNVDVESKYFIKSEKIDILNKLEKENYKKVVSFNLNSNYFYMFNNNLNYYYSGLVQLPTTINIYEKQ
ncbi:glycosyltransferase [Patescibacteria group bacterium]|nr:glycosyltransferase [Patescibacteria group bacterium]